MNYDEACKAVAEQLGCTPGDVKEIATALFVARGWPDPATLTLRLESMQLPESHPGYATRPRRWVSEWREAMVEQGARALAEAWADGAPVRWDDPRDMAASGLRHDAAELLEAALEEEVALIDVETLAYWAGEIEGGKGMDVVGSLYRYAGVLEER